MKIVALGSLDCADAIRGTVGKSARVFFSPPFGGNYDHSDYILRDASKSDLFFIRLHGYKQDAGYYGALVDAISPIAALTPDLVEQYDWSNTVILTEVCYAGADEIENAWMRESFLQNGAVAFIAAVGPAFGRNRPTLLDGEADLLSRLFIKAYERHRDVYLAYALALAKFVVLSTPLDEGDIETLKGYRVFERSQIT